MFIISSIVTVTEGGTFMKRMILVTLA